MQRAGSAPQSLYYKLLVILDSLLDFLLTIWDFPLGPLGSAPRYYGPEVELRLNQIINAYLPGDWAFILIPLRSLAWVASLMGIAKACLKNGRF